MATIRELCDFYVDRLIHQFRTLPKARDTVAICVKQALGDTLPDQLLNAFSVDTAVGPQLDTIGKYVGVPRNIGAVTPQPYFGFWSYSIALDPADYQGTWKPSTNDPALPTPSGGNSGWWYVASEDGVHGAIDAKCGNVVVSNGSAWEVRDVTWNGNGLTTYNDLASNANGVFFSYSSYARQSSDLSDASYRVVIKLKIILNSNDGTLASIMALMNTFFPGQYALVDNRDMTLSYLILSTVPLTQALLEAYLPKPMGVGITVTIISPNPPPPGGGDRLTTEDGDVITTEDGNPLISELI